MTLEQFYAQLTPDDQREARYQFEERAGIHMDSHATKEEAERLALEEVMRLWRVLI